MGTGEVATSRRHGDRSWLGIGGAAALSGLTVLAGLAGIWKVVIVAWIAFLAMAGGAFLGARTMAITGQQVVWAYGLASGAMVTSAALFLLPQALALHPAVGGIGVAVGLVGGYAGHTLGHRLAHQDFRLETTAAQLTAHSLAAGAIIGIIYGSLPELGLLLGLAIVSHKGPAGYAAARRLLRADRSNSLLLLPAAGVGLTAIPAALVTPQTSAEVNAVVFGFAAGVFLHVAMDFLPECEVGGEVGDVVELSGDAHAELDRLRVHAVMSTALGALAVITGWLLVS